MLYGGWFTYDVFAHAHTSCVNTSRRGFGGFHTQGFGSSIKIPILDVVDAVHAMVDAVHSMVDAVYSMVDALA